MASDTRLDDAALDEHLARLDALLEQVEQAPGPSARGAVAAVQALTSLYGEALARVLDLADPELASRLASDELLSHLLVLHGLHPEPPEPRAARAVERLRPALRERGGDAELVGITEGVATVRVRGKGCGCSAATVEEAVREAVLAAAPELTEVRCEPAEQRAGAFVPLEALRVGTGGAA